ncbi:MAG: hypothetical protein Q9167_007955, partial [Letrouitia subvulpina]
APRRRRRRSPERSLHARLRRYEQLLESYGVKIEELEGEPESRRSDNAVHRNSSVAESESPNTIQGGSSVEGVEPAAGHQDKLVVGVVNGLVSATRFDAMKHLEKVLEGSDDENPAPFETGYNHIMGPGGGVLFVLNPFDNLKKQHPNPVQIFKLWQAFLTNVNPLIMIFHAPSVQEQIIHASGDLKNITEATEALMFAVYACATGSLDDLDCKAIFREERTFLMAKWQRATQQALNTASLLKTLDIVVLQAFVLFLVAALQSWQIAHASSSSHFKLQPVFDPRSLWIHTGIAIRIGQRIGLHRDSNSTGLPFFEIEMRRRLWWQIVQIDTRMSELSGSETSALNDQWDVKLPLNVNDSILNPDMGDPPAAQTGLTDMTFPLVRYEVANFLRQKNAATISSGCWQRDSGERLLLAEKDIAIDELAQYLDNKYLRHCDPMVPLHLLLSKFTNTALSRMRFTAHHPRHLVDKEPDAAQKEKELILRLGLQLIENDIMVQSAKGIDRYKWFINMHFQFPVFIYILSELRHQPYGELATRAWQILDEAYKFRHPPGHERRKSPVFKAVAMLGMKAWQAREAEFIRRGESVLPPKYITTVRSIYGEPASQSKKDLDTSADSQLQLNASSIPRQNIQPVDLGQNTLPNSVNMKVELERPLDSNSTAPMDWSLMDWQYWDELVTKWDSQTIDGIDNLGFGQPHH